MDSKLTWQYGSEHPENSANLDAIRQWWSKLSGKTVLWQQRIVPDGEDVEQLDWESQRFDERFAIAEPELKGITVYWRKPDEEAPHNITAGTLELETRQQQLFVYPKSRPNVAIRVSLPQVKFETVELTQPEVQCVANNEKGLLVFRDKSQLLEVKVKLDAVAIARLKEQLTSDE